jgi:peroxiredoxin (alkyl hydroperoxide reductase subunit C)
LVHILVKRAEKIKVKTRNLPHPGQSNPGVTRLTRPGRGFTIASPEYFRQEARTMQRWMAFLAALWLVGWPGTLFAEEAKPADAPAHLLTLGEEAPAFAAETTQGRIRFPEDYKGKWVILFSHPSDFTAVCSTEILTLATMVPEFKALNCELIGLSVGSVSSHIAWLRDVQDKIVYKNMKNVPVAFPLIADVKLEIARQYGMLQPAASDTKTVRAVFFIDPKGKILAELYYPLSTGRNFSEIKRLLVALETADAYGVATPADWQPGEDVIMAAPATADAAQERVDKAGKEYYCLDWFMCFKKLGKEQVPPAPVKK